MNDICEDIFMENGLTEVHILKVRFQLMTNYNYIIVDSATRSAVIVDPAWEFDKIQQAIIQSAVELKGVLVTHSHPDHINLAAKVSEFYDCPVWMSVDEIEFSGFQAKKLVGIDSTPWYVDNMLINPIPTPGHTPGCICYMIDNSLFTGDVLFVEGCGICPDIDAAFDMYESLGRLKNMANASTRVFPGHSYGRPPGQEFGLICRENLYLQFKNRESFSAFRLRAGQNRQKIFSFS